MQKITTKKGFIAAFQANGSLVNNRILVTFDDHIFRVIMVMVYCGYYAGRSPSTFRFRLSLVFNILFLSLSLHPRLGRFLSGILGFMLDTWRSILFSMKPFLLLESLKFGFYQVFCSTDLLVNNILLVPCQFPRRIELKSRSAM
jgi:hypothetical protein